MGMSDDASKPSRQAEPAAAIRDLLFTRDRATLATVQRAGEGSQGLAGWPYASLVQMAADTDASPLLLISTLAEHTRNLLADPRASLLLDATAGLDEPLTGTRATVLGRLAISDNPDHRARYLARHPSAEMYAGFGDFAVWRMSVEHAHIVSGFGNIHWVTGETVIGTDGD